MAPTNSAPDPNASFKPSLTRREAVTVLASGFALAVQPVSAGTITTATQGLLAGEVQIPTPSGPIPAYRAQPAASPAFLRAQNATASPAHPLDSRRASMSRFLCSKPACWV